MTPTLIAALTLAGAVVTVFATVLPLVWLADRILKRRGF